jgi:type VI secretion system protein ImpE
MTPLELYKKGELQEAIRVLGEEIRANPLDAKRRTFLFELLCFAGEYDRAEKHIDVLAGMDAKSIPATLLYRSAIHAERTRQEMFRSGGFPKAESAEGDRGGEWNGKRFEYLGDADDRIGDHLEVFIAGGYTWVPTKYIERLEIEPPVHLRDLLWARARIQASPAFRIQDLGEVLLPVLAPLSYQSKDDAVRLGRVSTWEPDANGVEQPLGQKLLLVDGQELPLLEFRSIVFDPVQVPEAGGELADALT